MFLLVFFALLLLGHIYLWHRLRAAALPGLVGRMLEWLVLLAGVAVCCLFFFRRRTTVDLGLLEAGGFIWIGLVFYLVLFLGGWDVLRWGAAVLRWTRSAAGRRAAKPSISEAPPVPEAPAAGLLPRRVFLARAAAGGASLAASGVTFAAVRNARYEITKPEVAVRLPRLPRALDGFRIALLTDIHLGAALRRSFVEHVVELTNGLKPDAVAIVGDLVDDDVPALRDDVQPLADLRSRCGTYFVTGNHEFYSGVAQWVEYLPSLGVRVLQNERLAIGDRSPGGASFDLAGIHDPTGRRIGGGFSPNIARAVAGRDESRELVLLAHQPRQVIDAVRGGAGLQLAGHTHGGQIWPFGAMVLLNQPYLAGLHRHTPETQIYVSRGTGFWGPPMRVLAPAEITTIVLVAG